MALTSADAGKRSRAPKILCTGITVLDEVFQVEKFPEPDGKVQAKGFFVVNGGCAANAAVAIARLGARAALAGPLGGPPGEDGNGDRVPAPLFRIAPHVGFSTECLRATTGVEELGAALARVARETDAFLAVPNGPGDVLWLEGGALRGSPAFVVKAVDTLGAGDVFHGA